MDKIPVSNDVPDDDDNLTDTPDADPAAPDMTSEEMDKAEEKIVEELNSEDDGGNSSLEDTE